MRLFFGTVTLALLSEVDGKIPSIIVSRGFVEKCPAHFPPPVPSGDKPILEEPGGLRVFLNEKLEGVSVVLKENEAAA